MNLANKLIGTIAVTIAVLLLIVFVFPALARAPEEIDSFGYLFRGVCLMVTILAAWLLWAAYDHDAWGEKRRAQIALALAVFLGLVGASGLIWIPLSSTAQAQVNDLAFGALLLLVPGTFLVITGVGRGRNLKPCPAEA